MIPFALQFWLINIDFQVTLDQIGEWAANRLYRVGVSLAGLLVLAAKICRGDVLSKRFRRYGGLLIMRFLIFWCL